MLYAFWVFVILMNLLLGYQKQRVFIIQLITMLFIIVLMCGNTEGPDITGLIYVYAHPEAIELNDIGYDLLCIFFRDILNLDFFYFRYVITTVFMLMLWNTLGYYKVNVHTFLALYMCYLFFIDTIQHRNFYAMVTIAFTSRYLICFKRKDVIKFVVITLLVSTVHIITLTNFLYLIARRMKRRTAIITFAGLGSALAVFSLVVRVMGGNLMLMISMMFLPAESRVDDYFATQTKMSGYALGFLILWAVWLCYQARKRSLRVDEMNERSRQFIDIALLYGLVTLLFIGTLLLNVSFYRFSRNLLPIQFIAVVLAMDTYKVSAQPKFFMFLNILALALMWFVVDICLIEGYDICVQPIFEHNILWDGVPNV